MSLIGLMAILHAGANDAFDSDCCHLNASMRGTIETNTAINHHSIPGKQFETKEKIFFSHLRPLESFSSSSSSSASSSSLDQLVVRGVLVSTYINIILHIYC